MKLISPVHQSINSVACELILKTVYVQFSFLNKRNQNKLYLINAKLYKNLKQISDKA